MYASGFFCAFENPMKFHIELIFEMKTEEKITALLQAIGLSATFYIKLMTSSFKKVQICVHGQSLSCA